MPISADPQNTIPVSLETDSAIAESDRPVFYLRFLTARETSKAESLLKQTLAANVTEEEAIALYEQVIAIGVTGWKGVMFRGQPVPSDAKPGDFLTFMELRRLAHQVVNAPFAKEKDYFFSGSQAPCGPGSSAPPAPANATPNAAPANPSLSA